MYCEVVSLSELPKEMQFGQVPDDKFVVIKDVDGRILQTFSLFELINSPEQALNILKFGIDYAYALGAKTIVTPSPKVCAWLAHRRAEKYSDTRNLTPLQEKEYISLERQYNDISDRFAKNQMPQPIYKPTTNKIISFTIKGDHGHAYAVDAGATRCSCAAGKKSQECWHVRMIDIYLEGIEYERSS